MRLKFWSDVYPPEIKPVREGAYLTCLRPWATTNEVRIWRDARWNFTDGTECLMQDRYWKGIAFDPDLAEPCKGDLEPVDSRGLIAEVDGVWIPFATVEGGE